MPTITARNLPSATCECNLLVTVAREVFRETPAVHGTAGGVRSHGPAAGDLLDAAFATVLMPVRARASGNGPTAIGLTGSVMGAAAVGGSLIAAVAAHRLPRRAVFFTGFLPAGAPRFLVLAVDAPLGAVPAVFAVTGFGSGFLNPVLGAVLFERVPRRMPRRVNAPGDSLAWAGIPLGGLLAGAAVASVGLVPVLLACGTVYFLTTNLTGLRPEWREMDRAGGRGVVAPHAGETLHAAARTSRDDMYWRRDLLPLPASHAP